MSEDGMDRQQIMIIHSNTEYDSSIPFPPVGSIGCVVSGPDDCGDYELNIFGQPCPVGEPTWYAHQSMFVFLDPPKCTQIQAEREGV